MRGVPQSEQSSVAARIHGVREFFILKDAEALSTKLAAEVRESVARDVSIARQKREAAEVLWLGGGPAEALLLARDALDHVARAVERAHAADASPPLPSSAAKVRTDAASAPLPALDSEVATTHTERFYSMIAAHDELRSLVEPAALSVPEVAGRRRRRIAWASGAALVLAGIAVFATRTPRALKASASAVYDEPHNAARSVDGKPETEWLLPNKQTGWLELAVLPARKLKRVKLLNGHNPPYNDRQTNEYRLDVVGADGKVLKTVEASFGDFNAAPAPTVLELDTSEKVERLRFEVKSFHKDGAALAEIEVE